MTPDLRPYIERVNREHPELLHGAAPANTYSSCFRFVQLVIAAANVDFPSVNGRGEFQLMGKDGAASGYAPPGFVPFAVRVTRPDGEAENVVINRYSHDACWHVPSVRQIKVIHNSAANSDPDPAIHADGVPGGAIIEPQYYRYTNPPVPMFYGGDGPTPVPVPPTGSAPGGIVPQGEALGLLKGLDAFYRAPDGLQRPEGLGGDMEAIAQWFYQLVIFRKTLDEVKAQIRNSVEWKAKHP